MLTFVKNEIFIIKHIITMDRIDRIITETINHYLSEDENKNAAQKDDEKGTDQYAAVLDKENQNGELNIRKLASRISGIPTSTKDKSNVNKLNSIQSKLRKKIKREKGASGGRFHLTQGEVSDISQTIS